MSGFQTAARGLNRRSVRALALEEGFADAGLVAFPYADEARDGARVEQWIQNGCAGDMKYLERTGEDGRLLRSRASIPFPWARAALICFAPYHSAQPRSTDPAAPDAGWIARYAWSSRIDPDGTCRPSDYHKVLLKRLRRIEARLHEQFGSFDSRAFVDTGPVVERSLAVAAGLGWTGKNTCLIHPKLGSYGFLAVLLTALPVEENGAEDEARATLVPDRCGTCRRCLDACPTGALVEPRQMNANLCISYLTIEHRGPIADALMESSGRQVFGCDICQDVCPWNRKAPIATDGELEAREALVNPSLESLADLEEVDFERMFNGSPVRRTGFWGLRRNIAVAMGNSGLDHLIPRLEKWAEAADEGLRAAARWAILRLKNSPRQNTSGRAR